MRTRQTGHYDNNQNSSTTSRKFIDVERGTEGWYELKNRLKQYIELNLGDRGRCRALEENDIRLHTVPTRLHGKTYYEIVNLSGFETMHIGSSVNEPTVGVSVNESPMTTTATIERCILNEDNVKSAETPTILSGGTLTDGKEGK